MIDVYCEGSIDEWMVMSPGQRVEKGGRRRSFLLLQHSGEEIKEVSVPRGDVM